MRAVRILSYRTLWSLPILLLLASGSTTNAEDKQSDAGPVPSSSAPKGYRDFTLGMTRKEAWKTFKKLSAKTGEKGTIVIPSYERVKDIDLYFSDGIRIAIKFMESPVSPFYADAELYTVHVTFAVQPRPVASFMNSFEQTFGKPHRRWTFDRMFEVELSAFYTPNSVNDLDSWLEWRWPQEDTVAWLFSTEDHVAFDRYPGRFSPHLTIERGACTFFHERDRYKRERSLEESAVATDLAAGALGKKESRARPAPSLGGTFFGAPIHGRQIFCTVGPTLWEESALGSSPVEERADVVVWREFRSFVQGLPPTIAIPHVERWTDVYERPDQPHFLPAVTRTKAENLGALRYGTLAGAVVPTRKEYALLREVVTETRKVPLRELPLFVLDRVVKTGPDVVVFATFAEDFPATGDAVLAWSLEKISLPRFEIMEIAREKKSVPHKGLEALAKVSGGRYRIWVAADQPLVTVVEPEEK